MKISNIVTKIIAEDKEDNQIEFAIKMLVENDTEKDHFYIELQGLDSDGFEIYDIMEECTIPIGESREFTRKYDYVDKELFSKIVKWQQK